MHLKKRPVALLEVLIALTLILLCAIPLIRQPIANHQAEMAQMERIEAGRMAACAFTEIREAFLKKQFRWKQIPPLKGVSERFFLADAPLQLPPFPSRPIERSYILTTMEEKHEEGGKIFRLVAVKLRMGKNEFTYKLTLFKEGVEPKKEAISTGTSPESK